MRKLFLRVLEQKHFALVDGRERRVAAFTAEGDPAIVGGNQTRHAEPRARAKQTDHAILLGLAAADLHALLVGQTRQRHRERREVVDHEQRVEAERTARRLDREAPMVIGHLDLVAIDGVRDRDRRVIDVTDLRVLQILANRIRDARIFRARIYADLLDLIRTEFEREARIRSADVGKKPRAIRMRAIVRRRGGLIPLTSRHRVLLPYRSPASKWHCRVDSRQLSRVRRACFCQRSTETDGRCA